MPVELPTRYELVFNLATAKALRHEIPAELLALADQVIGLIKGLNRSTRLLRCIRPVLALNVDLVRCSISSAY